MTDPNRREIIDPCKHPMEVQELGSDTLWSMDCIDSVSSCASCLAWGADDGQHECENPRILHNTVLECVLAFEDDDDDVPVCFLARLVDFNRVET